MHPPVPLFVLVFVLELQCLCTHALPVSEAQPVLGDSSTSQFQTNAGHLLATAEDDPVAAALTSRIAAVDRQLIKAMFVDSETVAPTNDEHVFMSSVHVKNVKQGE